jgi:hypothetical protein
VCNRCGQTLTRQSERPGSTILDQYDAAIESWRRVFGEFRVLHGLKLADFNYESTGCSVCTVGAKPQTGAFTDSNGDMNEFKNPTAAIAAFDYPFPGGVGSRNVLRGPGYFGFDMALRKEWNFTERQKVASSWEVFNVTNSVRFDVFSALPAIDEHALREAAC